MAPSFKYNTDQLHAESISLLSSLISIPSFSREEEKTADLLERYFKNLEIPIFRKGNNIWVKNQDYSEEKPTILLNSHHDTVKPNASYTLDPFDPIQKEGKLFGLGSNDAGGALVSMIMAFLYFYNQKDMKYNLMLAATCEEEISGAGGVRAILRELGTISFGLVGEPTDMNMAIHEKGLMVLDCEAKGKAGHAARDEGKNALYEAIADIQWFRTFRFPQESKTLGPIKMSVTMIEAGTQHNMVPDTCKFVVDVRTTDAYTNEETLEIIRQHVKSEVKERSTILQPSRISEDHELVAAAKALDMELFGSPTLSDQAVMPFPTVKIGPGSSSRSHTADEFIYIDELKEGIMGYLMLLNKVVKG